MVRRSDFVPLPAAGQAVPEFLATQIERSAQTNYPDR
jgi:hypothetical protein